MGASDRDKCKYDHIFFYSTLSLKILTFSTCKTNMRLEESEDIQFTSVVYSEKNSVRCWKSYSVCFHSAFHRSRCFPHSQHMSRSFYCDRESCVLEFSPNTTILSTLCHVIKHIKFTTVTDYVLQQ